MASISVDLDTLDSVRYKLCSFLVGQDLEPTIENNSIQLDVPSAPSIGRINRVNLVSAAAHIPAYRLFETKKYNGTLAVDCCICLSEIRKGTMVVSMPLCGHLYHKACLFNWVDLSKNTFCPYCRQDDF